MGDRNKKSNLASGNRQQLTSCMNQTEITLFIRSFYKTVHFNISWPEDLLQEKHLLLVDITVKTVVQARASLYLNFLVWTSQYSDIVFLSALGSNMFHIINIYFHTISTYFIQTFYIYIYFVLFLNS